MKLIIDASTIHSGGGLEHLKNLIFFLLKKKNIKITIICPYNLQKDLKNFNVNLILVKRGAINLFLFYFNNKNSFKCDFYLSLNGIFIPKNCSGIIFFHNLLIFDDNELSRHNYSLFNIKAKLQRLILKYNYNKSKIAIFFSSSSKKIIKEKIKLNNQKDIIIRHGINEKFYTKKNFINNPSKKNIKLVYPSSLLFYKNHLNLMNSLKNYKYKDFKIEIFFIGQKFEYIERQIKNFKNFNNNVFFIYLGNYDQNQQIEMFNEMDAILYSSSCETFGFSIYEGALSGLPIICSDKITCREILGDNVFYFNPFKKESLNNAITNFIENPLKAADYSIKNQNIVSKLIWSDQIDKLFKILEQLNNEKKNIINIQ